MQLPRGPPRARKVEAARARLEEANAPNRAFFEKVEPVVNTFCPGLAKMPYHIDRWGGGHRHTQAAWAKQ